MKKFLLSVIFLVSTNAFAALIYGFNGEKIKVLDLQEILQSSSPDETLSSPFDTSGPSFTMAIGSASERIIRAVNVSGATGAPGVGYYSDATCSTLIGQASVLSTGDSFTFTDAAPIYFGQTALSALSEDDPATRCIVVGLMQAANGGPSQAYLFLEVQNLTCNGTVCTGGNVCYTGPGPDGWSASNTPAC